MTKVWGPMGWMTLHSISICYPEQPTDADKKILQEFMGAFGNSITCVHCRSHFAQMFADYRSKVPTWLNSRRDLVLAVCRMHNAVNKRLDKPQPKTLAECIETLKNATRYTSPREFRDRYANYLIGDWWKERHHGEGIAGLRDAQTVKRINDEYWNFHEVSYSDVSFEEDNVLNYSQAFKSQTPVIPKFNLNSLLGLRL